jgi:DNA mismatch repair protein MSH6
VNLIAELDCLVSLSIVSGQQEGVMCRPHFIPYEGDFKNSSLLDIKQLRHPCVNNHSKKPFVPNNIQVLPNQN